MTKLLEEALARASKLPSEDQEAFGAWILEELAQDSKWDRAFADSAAALDSLADEALAEHRAGRTKPLANRGG